jgi:ribosomal-protein-serine acetyltransferase
VLPIELPDGHRLRLFEEADADELYALVARNRAHLGPWMPWVHAHDGPPDSLAFIRATRRQVAEDNGFQVAITEDARIVGTIGFHAVDWRRRATSLGYWLDAGHEGRGIMTTAVRALVDHAFGPWRLQRVEIRAATANARSRAIPARLGFRQERVLPGAERHPDRTVDLVVYAITAREWRQRGESDRAGVRRRPT